MHRRSLPIQIWLELDRCADDHWLTLLMTTPVRALFVIPSLEGGGAERVMLTLARHLDPTQVRPSLFVTHRLAEYWNEIPSGITVEWGINSHQRLYSRLVPVMSKLVAAAKKSDIVVGALELLPSYMAYVAAALARKPALAWVHCDMPKQLPVYGKRHAQVQPALIRLFYPRFRRIIFPSRNALEGFESILPLNKGTAVVIENPIDVNLVLDRAQEELPGWGKSIFEKPTVIAVGRLHNPHKGFDILVRAHALAKNLGCDHNLLILGEGPDRNCLTELAVSLNVAKSTFLPGFQSNPYPFISAARILAVPSRTEAFGLGATEAMTLGTPVLVASSALGTLEVIENGECGRVFSAEDAASLAMNVCELLRDQDLRETYSARGRERSRRFNPDQITQRWENVLWQVVKPMSPRTGDKFESAI